MATSLSAALHIEARGLYTATSPHSGDVREDLENAVGGTRWTNGTGSGNVDRIYRRTGSLSAAATHNYDLLAAGGLTDVYGQAIDADELKAMVLKVTSGAIKIDAPASGALNIFADASDVIKLQNGATFALDWGAGGLDVTANSKFDIVETAGSTATYELWLVVAQ